jgi:hypothetical protein
MNEAEVLAEFRAAGASPKAAAMANSFRKIFI